MKKQEPKRRSRKAPAGISAGHREYLGRSRRRRHAEAAADEPVAAAIPDHPLICADETEFIADQAALDAALARLKDAGRFAFDTEFIGEQTYYPHLCLIQVATESFVAVIDAVADLDLGGFWALVADASIEKIVHAGGQDLEPAGRLTGNPAVNVYDTQIAAGFVGLPYPLNLREMVYRFTGARLHKSSGFTQWDARPLTETQLRYAADDVRYLPAVRAALVGLLSDAGATDWAAEEMAAACREACRGFDASAQALKMRGARDLSARQLAVLAELLGWREAYAAACNAPARAVANDDAMRNTAKRHTRLDTLAALRKIGTIPSRILDDAGEDILAALARGREAETDALRRHTPSQESAAVRQAIDHLWVLVQAVAFARSVHPALVTSRKELADILESGRRASDDSEPDYGPLLTGALAEGWRGELLGDLLGKVNRRGVADLKLSVD